MANEPCVDDILRDWTIQIGRLVCARRSMMMMAMAMVMAGSY
jgi:hypothetical protein